jgi:hypothetical protein
MDLIHYTFDRYARSTRFLPNKKIPLKETKRIFQDPDDILTLKDFNRLCARIDKNSLNKLFKETLHDPKVFSRNVIN